MALAQLNWLDYVAIGLVGLSTLFGLMRGMVKEVMGIIGWVLAFVLAKLASDTLAHYLQRWIETPSFRLVSSYVLIFIVTLVMVAIITSMLGFAVDKTGLGPLNRLLGATFGLIRGYLLWLVIILLAGLTALPQQTDWQQSQSIRLGLWGVSHLAPYLPREVIEFFHF